MSLSDLIKYMPAQMQAINQLPSGFDSTTAWCTTWMGFRDALWGKGLESLQQQERVKRDDNPVEDVNFLPDWPPSTCAVVTIPNLPCGWTLGPSGWVLVQSKYLEAKKAAVLSSKTNDNMFVVTGQLGISLLSSFFMVHRI